jgi:hypothetical protein
MNTSNYPTLDYPSGRRIASAALCTLIGLGGLLSHGLAADLPIEIAAWRDLAEAESVTFTTTAKSADGKRLELRLHNVQYETMATVVLNGKSWPIANNTKQLTVLGDAQTYGGIGGGYNTLTIRIELPISGNGAIKPNATNTLTFRLNNPFNRDSSAFRVLSIAVRNANNEDFITPNSFTSASNPDSDFIAPTSDSNIDFGEELWKGTAKDPNDRVIKLIAYPGGPQIRASCADCHTRSGADLRYFGFSNKSITRRAQFHGLKENEAKKLTRYIRSKSFFGTAVTIQELGRPWNPPYQPAPGTTGRSASRWAAGGGLEAVLASDKEMLPHLFPDGSDEETLPASSYGDIRSNFNKANGNSADTALQTPDIPLPFQLPDWNRWLPTIYPGDLWENFDNTSNTTVSSAPYRAYKAALELLGATERVYSANTPAEKTKMLDIVKKIGAIEDQCRELIAEGANPAYENEWADRNNNASWRALSPVWLTDTFVRKALGLASSVPVNPTRQRAARELAKRSLASWLALKHFELMQEWDLEDKAAILAPAVSNNAVGDKLGWPLDRESVFAKAPHITADSIVNWGFKANNWSNDISIPNQRVGFFLSVAWYQLQIVLNCGHRMPSGSVHPVDWKYQLDHVNWLAQAGGAAMPLVHTMNLMKIHQTRATGDLVNGWLIRITDPHFLIADTKGDTTLMAKLDGQSYTNASFGGLWGAINKAAVQNYVDVVTSPSLKIDNSEPNTHPNYSGQANSNFVNKKADGALAIGRNWPREGETGFGVNEGYLNLEVESSSINLGNFGASPIPRTASEHPNYFQGTDTYFTGNRIRNFWRYLAQVENLGLVPESSDNWVQDTDPAQAGNQPGLYWELEEWCEDIWPGPAASPNVWHPTGR